jgi:hypothetical protein
MTVRDKSPARAIADFGPTRQLFRDHEQIPLLQGKIPEIAKMPE